MSFCRKTYVSMSLCQKNMSLKEKCHSVILSKNYVSLLKSLFSSILFNNRRKNFNLNFWKKSTNTSRALKNGRFLPLFAKLHNPLSSSELANLSSLISPPSSLKDICFRVRKLSFRLPKDRVLHSKTRSFATRNIYLWEWRGVKVIFIFHSFFRNIYVSLAKNANFSWQNPLTFRFPFLV